MKDHSRRKAPGAKEAKHTAAWADADDQTQTPEILAQYRREIISAVQAVKVSFPHRLDAPQAWDEWKAAVCYEYAVLKKCGALKYGTLWSNHAPRSEEETRHGWDFWRDLELLYGGDHTQVGIAVAFLASNLYFFHSGYTKERIIRALKPAMLTPDYARRLAQVILTVVDARDDYHFRAFCRLARKVDAPALREQLTARLTSGDAGIRRRARWVLEALAQKDSQAKEKKGTRG